MAIKLRGDIEIHPGDDGVELVDPLTRFRFFVEGATFRGETGREVDAGLAESFSALGLLDENLPSDAIIERQRRTRIALHREERLSHLNELLRHCVTHIPYYRAQSDVYGSPLKSLADLSRLPLLRKADLRAHFPKGMVADDLDIESGLAAGSLEFASTSGTTGERLQVLVDLGLEAVPWNYQELWGLNGAGESPKTAVLTGPLCVGTECHLGKLQMKERIRAENTLVLNSADDLFSMDEKLVKNIAEEMDEFRPDILLVNPMYLHWLGRLSRRFGIVLPPVKLILSSYQYLSRLQRHALQTLFGCRVIDFYAATDLAGAKIAVECERGRLHVRGDQSIVEIVGRDGARGEDVLGAVAVTTLAGRIMPAVRYLVGDVGRLTRDRCDCVAPEWECFELHGRMKDLLRVNDRWITTREVDNAVAELTGIEFYKCVQTGDSNLSFEVVPTEGSHLDLTALSVHLGDTLSASVRVKPVKRLDPEPSLKFRLTQSECAAPGEFAL